ncbi:MAG: D-alanyl-D-alanine carboxypeptidase [Firmicutes bacterium]|nr:D-alanyl-D-alanine carboxypeptidase [Bacillota bacterium]
MSEKKLTKRQLRRRRERNRRIVMFLVGFLLVGLIFSGILFLLNKKQGKEKPEEKENGKRTEEQVQDTVKNTLTPTPTATPEPAPTVDLRGIDSKAAILVRLLDGQVVAEKEADTRIYPASMTKIMTAIIGLENISDLNQMITIDRSMYDRLYLEGASMAGFAPGDQVKAIDILYGVMLPSGAECCVGLAEYLFGSEEAFGGKMNEKAAELGMENTHFVTSTGLHDPEHYTTVRDLTKLLTYALQNETFRAIYTAHEYTTSPTAGNPEGLHFLSTMFKKMETSAVNGGEIEGGKTGYTSDAGQCLASLAVINDKEYILVTAGAQGSPSTEPYHILDAIQVYNQIGGETGQTAPAAQPAA